MANSDGQDISQTVSFRISVHS